MSLNIWDYPEIKATESAQERLRNEWRVEMSTWGDL